jgi:hypothetical protein
MLGTDNTDIGLHDAYRLPNDWRLVKVDHGFRLLAPTTGDGYEPCGLLRHHIKSFVAAFNAVPVDHAEIRYRFDKCVVDTEETHRQLPTCYDLPSGWKLVKSQTFFTLTPSNRIFNLPAGMLSDYVAQFVRDLGGRAIVPDEPDTEPYVRAAEHGLYVIAQRTH